MDDDARRRTDASSGSGLRHAADPAAQEQAAREQAIERVQDEVDARSIESDRPEPEDALEADDQRRVFDLTSRRIPHA